MIIELDYSSDTPIYVQLRNEIVRGIGSGNIQYGESLPTVRQLADDLHVNAMTINKAYAVLKQEGFIQIDRRHGAKVLPVYDTTIEYQSKVEEEIALIASEAIIKGMEKEDFIELCKTMLENITFSSISKLNNEG